MQDNFKTMALLHFLCQMAMLNFAFCFPFIAPVYLLCCSIINGSHTGGCALHFPHFKADGYPHILLFPVIFTVDRSGYNLSAYALAILVHIYNSLINMGCLHILPHI